MGAQSEAMMRANASVGGVSAFNGAYPAIPVTSCICRLMHLAKAGEQAIYLH